MGCPIRTSTDQRLLAAPRGFSQRATSFIASWCQGIHRMPFLCSRSRPPCTGAIHTRSLSESNADGTATAGLSTHATLIHPLTQTTSVANASERPCCCRGQPDPAHAKPAYRSDLRPQRAQRRTRTIFTLTKTTPGQDHRPARTPTARRPLLRAEKRAETRTPATTSKPAPACVTPSGGFPRSRLLCRRVRQSGPRGNGGDRVRTDDPLLAKQVLSQLSYTPF